MVDYFTSDKNVWVRILRGAIIYIRPRGPKDKKGVGPRVRIKGV